MLLFYAFLRASLLVESGSLRRLGNFKGVMLCTRPDESGNFFRAGLAEPALQAVLQDRLTRFFRFLKVSFQFFGCRSELA